MKNLLVFIHPAKKFDDDREPLARIQIDNSYSLGYKKEDIIYITNFPYEYNGVKAIVVGDEHYCAVRPRSLKTAIVPYLIDQNIIENGKLYWNHDFDAYQVNVITEEELGLDDYDTGLTDYGWREKWCMGSYFIKSSSKDIYKKAKEIIFQDVEDEHAMYQLTQGDPDIAKRCKRLNISYNLGMKCVQTNYTNAIKPLKVLHFHPIYKRVRLIDIFMYGQNRLRMPLMSDRLIKIFHEHGIK